MTLLKTLSVGLTALALASSAMGQTFFDQSQTVQGKLIDLGRAGRTQKYAAFTTNGNFSATTSSTTSPSNVDVEGNVGVWKGNFSASNSRIDGNLLLRKGGSYSAGGSGGVNGSISQNNATDSLLSGGASDASTLSSNINSLSQTTNWSSNFSLSSGNIITSASSNFIICATNNSPVVLKLNTFALQGGTLTLNGSADSEFIINVSGNFGMSLGGKVVLTGGIEAGDVIFNLAGAGVGSMSGAGTTLNGILVASNRSWSQSGGSVVNGQVIAKSISLSGGSKIKKPKKPSP